MNFTSLRLKIRGKIRTINRRGGTGVCGCRRTLLIGGIVGIVDFKISTSCRFEYLIPVAKFVVAAVDGGDPVVG